MKAADDGAEIAGNMLKFTKTSPDTKEFVSFDIRDLIRHSIDFTKPRWQNEALAEGIDYRIDTEGMGRVPSIMCNPAEIREVFINIINNALDAMSGGGKISFGTWSDNETVFVNVTDDGDGISDNVKKNIFDPFFTTKGVEGTGLGMSIVYGIVTRHSGKIEVDGELGKGTAFTMQFPVTIKRRRVIKISAPEQKTNEKSLRILVIDDEESMRDILNQFLSKGGHDVKTTDNGVNVLTLYYVILRSQISVGMMW
jgi:signal transduction histidine kinase